MDIIYKYRKNCYNLSDSEDQYVLEWVNNETSDTLISIAPAPVVPYLIYTKWDDTNFQWCGPMLMIAKYFAKFSKTRVKLDGYQTEQSIVNAFMKKGFDGLPHIGLWPFTASTVYYYFAQWDLLNLAKITATIGYGQCDGILAKTNIIGDPLFKQFKCLEWDVYYAIFVSIIAISLVISLYKNSIQSFFIAFWNYSAVILSDYYSLPIKTVIDRLLTSGWLIACTVLLAAFSGLLRDQQLKPKTIKWIESLEDLYEWSHLNIVATHQAQLSVFLDTNENNTMVIDLNRRFDRIRKDENLVSFNFHDTFDVNDVKQGKVAIIHPVNHLRFYKKNFSSDNFKEDIDFHIAEDNPQPFFLITYEGKLDVNSSAILDLVINILRESGIYDEELKIAFNPQRMGPDISEKTISNSYELEDINISQIEGILYLYLIFNLNSVIAFTVEICAKLIKQRNDKIDHLTPVLQSQPRIASSTVVLALEIFKVKSAIGIRKSFPKRRLSL